MRPPAADSAFRLERPIFIVGGTGLLGYRVVRALLDEGATVTALLRPDQEDKLGALRERVRIVTGDVWNPGSLRGRARGHAVVVHLIGGVQQDPARGLTFRHLNFTSARNAVQMAVNDGVPHCVFLSAATLPLVNRARRDYIESKREAERHLQKSGLAWTIIRAPSLYEPGSLRNPLLILAEALSRLPFVGRPFHRAPLAFDTAARGIAALTLAATAPNIRRNRRIAPGQLRLAGRAAESALVGRARRAGAPVDYAPQAVQDEPPFGWLPPR